MKPTGRRKPGEIRTEDNVKDLAHAWYKDRAAFSFSPVSNGMGVHGLPDRMGCVPVVVTIDMVGKEIGLFIAVEAKRPGRRGEKNRGMKQHQVDRATEIIEASGISICCDGREDLAGLDVLLDILCHTKSPKPAEPFPN